MCLTNKLGLNKHTSDIYFLCCQHKLLHCNYDTSKQLTPDLAPFYKKKNKRRKKREKERGWKTK